VKREKRGEASGVEGVVVVEDGVWSLMDGAEGGAKSFQGLGKVRVADHSVVWRVRRSTKIAGCRNNRCRLRVTVIRVQRCVLRVAGCAEL